MDSISKKIAFIFRQNPVTGADIAYALELKGVKPSAIATKCGCTRQHVTSVINGADTSSNVATYISAALQVSVDVLWPGKYSFTPRRPRSPAQHQLSQKSARADLSTPHAHDITKQG